MPLVFKNNGGGGDFESIPIVKYDARAGRVSLEDRVQGAAGWEKQTTPVADGKFKAVVDLENIETGWMLFASGVAPDFRLFPMNTDIGAPPSSGHKEGFRVMMKMAKDCGGDVRELSATAACVKSAFASLYASYEAAKKPVGTLPVVTMPKTTQITTGSGAKKSTNYQPDFQIVDWVQRPADLVFKPKAASHAPIPGPASTGATLVGPPPAAVAAASSDFG